MRGELKKPRSLWNRVATISLVAWLLLVTVPVLLSSCGHGSQAKTKMPTPSRVIVERQPSPCLTQEPPSPPSILLAVGADQGVPPAFAACFAQPELAKLALYVDALASWAEQAWIACREVPP